MHVCRQRDANTITRVEIVDSSGNGILIGAAVAAALVYGIHRWEDATVPDSNNMKGMATIALGGISAALAIGFGERIDLSMNQAIYERRSRAPTLTLAPWVEPHVKGIRAQFRF